MAETNEPRALSAALAAPAFATRGAGLAMHVADRHVERWAPEVSANRVRPMRSLGFVDRLIAPWIETAQRSASLRLFDQYAQDGFTERPSGAVSWVFPRPWYQDELDWMAAARRAPQQEAALFTTRGTYVSPAQVQAQQAVRAPSPAMPAALYEYVAPSMSIAQPSVVAGVGYGGESVHADAYSPLIPLAAVQAAHLMARTVAPALAPATAGARMSPALRGVLSAMIERAAGARAEEPSRLALSAPELVTPPAPRLPEAAVEAGAEARPSAADQLAEHYAAQRARIVELQRIAQRSAERELAARAGAAATSASATVTASASASAATAPAAVTAPAAARSAELQEAARRAEAQLREAAAARTLSEEQRQRLEAERVVAAAAERSRLEERVAQRVAERAAAQRLHEQSRAEAAEHARAAITAAPAPSVVPESDRTLAMRQPPPEVASAIAALPPELASFIGQRPERAMQAIEELDVALRTIELIARGAATGASFEATRGPRLVMPAGLGGLVSAVDRTTASPWLGGSGSFGEQAALAATAPAGGSAPAAPAGLAVTAPAAPARPFVAPALAAATRVPSLPWLAAATPRGATGTAPATMGAAPVGAAALAATAATPPAALAHVAWADRWLARFAGASQTSLDTLAAPARMEALAAAAPTGVFVSPTFDIERDASPARNVERLVAAAERRPTLIPPPAPVIRYADDAETPDDVFMAISAAVTRQRTQPAPQAPASSREAVATTSASTSAEASGAFVERTPADVIAASAPAAPNAGLSAQLAASPFAPALRHVLPMPSATSFDVRSLFGGGVSAAYLAGLLSADSRELELAPRALPSWASPGLEILAGSLERDAAVERLAPAWDATYVAPSEPGADAIAGDDASSSFQPPRTDAAVPALSSPRAGEVAPLEPAAAAAAERAAQAIAAASPITTLRTALLSWSGDASPGAAAAPGVLGWAGAEIAEAASAGEATLASAGAPMSAARAMLESMSLPMLGDVIGADDRGGAWTAPGMIASRAHSWSVAQERSASDLALDFVTPELVLAARVYGLGPSEAAQAARLAIAGSGHLTAMAGTVDRAFMQAMAIDSDRRERLATLMTAYPVAASAVEPTAAQTSDAGAPRGDRAEAARSEVARAEVARAEATRAASASVLPEQVPGGTAFGVDRRPPRGAFLWPSASVAALGLNAPVPDGEIAMSVAALELLAARAVAELGTFAVLDTPSLGEAGGIARAGGVVGGAAGSTGAAAFDPIYAETGGAAVAGSTGSTGAADAAAAEDVIVDGAAGRGYPFLSGARRLERGAGPAAAALGTLGEPGERDVLAVAGELVSPARRARFEALYLALGQSTSGRSWSPAARAARALALAGQTDDAPLSARERATAAWDVLPVVYASEGLLDAATGVAADGTPGATTGSSAAAAGAPLGVGARELPAALGGRELRGASAPPSDWVGSYAGPGLGALSARAGEALGSYVAPMSASASTSSSSWSPSSSEVSSSSRDRGEQGAVLRAPTAMQELVRTGRPAGRHGGGETEIPPWFEAAARKMFESQGTIAGDISLAELTLVTAAPSTQIAASTRTSPAAAPAAPAAGSASEAGGSGPSGIDVESTAQEIYRYILTMMDAARARNGEPYL